jgi:type II secretory pathway predicted ATPase ExeA
VIERLRAHYGFGRTPFGRDLAPGMLHPHRGHAEAVARIAWLISERAIGVVTGEVGASKTVAARAATAALDPVRHTIVYLANPLIGQRGLYAEIVRSLGGTPRFYKASLVAQAAELLAAEEAEKAKTSVLILDEAHLLSAEQLEEVRMLTNHDMDARSPFACLLLGQPTLRRRLKIGTLAALDQRVALRFNLDGMTWPRPSPTSSTTSSSPAAPTPCSATTRSAWYTRPPAASPARSTTSPSRP